jgi:hypothetical protein
MQQEMAYILPVTAQVEFSPGRAIFVGIPPPGSFWQRARVTAGPVHGISFQRFGSPSPSPVNHGSLPVVALFAQDLPVRLVPEEIGIALVWNDVIHNSCGLNASLPSTLGAEWMNA